MPISEALTNESSLTDFKTLAIKMCNSNGKLQETTVTLIGSDHKPLVHPAAIRYYFDLNGGVGYAIYHQPQGGMKELEALLQTWETMRNREAYSVSSGFPSNTQLQQYYDTNIKPLLIQSEFLHMGESGVQR